jgi:RNA polymerase sigma-70 factor (ECF subfamily)
MPASATRPAASAPEAGPPLDDGGESARRFERVYHEHFDFVWRSVRRLGAPAASVDDAVQDVFVIVHRRLGEFEPRASLKTWLFSIALRVVGNYRRAARRADGYDELDPRAPAAGPDPHESAARREALELFDRALGALDDEKRAVFILAELEQMTAPEIAEALGVKLNTVYSRLRVARQDFTKAYQLHGARAR